MAPPALIAGPTEGAWAIMPVEAAAAEAIMGIRLVGEPCGANFGGVREAEAFAVAEHNLEASRRSSRPLLATNRQLCALKALLCAARSAAERAQRICADAAAPWYGRQRPRGGPPILDALARSNLPSSITLFAGAREFFNACPINPRKAFSDASRSLGNDLPCAIAFSMHPNNK